MSYDGESKQWLTSCLVAPFGTSEKCRERNWLRGNQEEEQAGMQRECKVLLGAIACTDIACIPVLSFALRPSLQADAGAQVVQIFDSWASHLSPQDFDVFSGPYIRKVSAGTDTHRGLGTARIIGVPSCQISELQGAAICAVGFGLMSPRQWQCVKEMEYLFASRASG